MALTKIFDTDPFKSWKEKINTIIDNVVLTSDERLADTRHVKLSDVSEIADDEFIGTSILPIQTTTGTNKKVLLEKLLNFIFGTGTNENGVVPFLEDDKLIKNTSLKWDNTEKLLFVGDGLVIKSGETYYKITIVAGNLNASEYTP